MLAGDIIPRNRVYLPPARLLKGAPQI